MEKFNLTKIIADNLNKTGHISNVAPATLPIDGWINKYKKGGSVTPNKAREILHDKEVHGHPLTEAQRKFFGAMSKGNTMHYKKGGGYFPEYHSWAPPRMDLGGLTKYQPGGMITDPMGQWSHPGQNTRIPGGNITMQGVNYPVLGRANTGQTIMMQPGQDYNFSGADHVDEYPIMQKGGELTPEELASLNRAKMRSKMALAAEFGNPSAKRMTSVSPSSYRFTGNEMINGKPTGVPAGETGTHFMSSMGKYAVPFIQEGSNGNLQFNPNASFRDREAIRFDNSKDAQYFAEHYKDVAPMMQNYKKNGGSWLGKYDKGGPTNNPKGYVSMKNNKDWFDSHANWTNTGNPKWDAKVREQVMTGRFGVDPNSGALIKLPQNEWTNISEEDKRLNKDKRQWTPAQKQTSWKQQVTPTIVKGTKDLITNPIAMAPGAILTGGMLSGIPAIARTAAAIAPALNAPLLGTLGAEYGTGALTAQNLIGLGFGLNGASNLGSDINNGYYSSATPLTEKLGRGLETAMDISFSPGVVKGLGMGYGALKNSSSLNNKGTKGVNSSFGNWMVQGPEGPSVKLATDANNTIQLEGQNIMQDLSSPEGVTRLRNQFKIDIPNATEEQLDHLVGNRLREVNTSMVNNKARFYLRYGKGALGTPSYAMEKHLFPEGNASFENNYNPFPEVDYEPVPTSLNFNTGSIAPQTKGGMGDFSNPDYRPGSITLGNGYQFDPHTVRHEAHGHALQGSGWDNKLPLEHDLLDLVKPKSVRDKLWFKWQKRTQPDFLKNYNYFTLGNGSSRESYPFLVENRSLMKERGLINNTYDKVEADQLLKHKQEGDLYTKFGIPNSNDRFLKLFPRWKLPKVAKIWNAAPVVVTGAGLTSVLSGGDKTTNSTPQQKYGGWLKKYYDGGPTSFEKLTGIKPITSTNVASSTYVKKPIVKEFDRLTLDNPKASYKSQIDKSDKFLKNWYSGRASDPRFTKIAKERYNEIDNINEIPLSAETLARENASGFYINGGKDIYLNPKDPYSRSAFVQTHEKTHELYDQIPQKWQTGIIKSLIVPKNKYTKIITPGSEFNYDYYSDPSEVAARLNVFRRRFNLDPKHKYSAEEMETIMDRFYGNQTDENWDINQQSGDSNVQDLFNILGNSPKKLAELNDRIVMNKSNPKEMNTAKHGGQLPKAQDGRTIRAANAEFSCNAFPRGKENSTAVSNGVFTGFSNAPVTWNELIKYNDTNPKDKVFKNRLRDLQTQFPGLTSDQLMAAQGDSTRIKQRMSNLPRYDKPAEQTYDKAYHNFYRTMMNQPTPVTTPQILQFHSQQPGGVGGYQQTVQSNYGRPKAKKGGWITKYYDGGQTEDTPSQVKKSLPGLDWLKTWVSSPKFKDRLVNMGRQNPEEEQATMLGLLDQYKPKTYRDLRKEMGLKEWLSLTTNTEGVSYGTPDQIYVKHRRGKRGRALEESARVHELTHMLENNGNWFTPENEAALQESFTKRNILNRLFNSKKEKEYFTDPTEIHARMNQARIYYNLTPDQEFTPEMYDEMQKKKEWFGLKPYLKDKKSFIKLMNEYAANEPIKSNIAKYGGNLTKYKPGGPVTENPVKKSNTPPAATYADSLEVYNNATAVRNYYEGLRKKGFYSSPKVTNTNGLSYSYFKNNMEDVKNQSLATYRRIINRGPNKAIFSYEDYKNAYPNATKAEYLNKVRQSLVDTKSGSGDKYYYKDLYPSQIDPNAPSTLVNLKILPNEFINYDIQPGSPTPPGGIITGLFGYNPLAVKPYKLRTPQEKIQWEKKYGKNKLNTINTLTRILTKFPVKPKDPSIKPQPFKEQQLIHPSINTNPQLIERQHNNVQLPNVERGKYRTSYWDAQAKDWDEKAFMTEQESNQFANEMGQRGYGAPYGNVTQRVQYQKYGGSTNWLKKYQPGGPTIPYVPSNGRDLARQNMGSGESTSLGTINKNQIQILNDVAKKQDFNKYVTNQPKLKQGRVQAPVEAYLSNQKKKEYVQQHPNTILGNDNEIVTKNQDRGFENQPLTPNAKRFDKGLEHIMNAMDAAGMAIGAGELAHLGYGALKSKINPIRFIENISNKVIAKKLNKYTSGLKDYIKDPTVQKRLMNAGMTQEEINSMELPKFTIEPHEQGSHYDPFENTINIDLPQARELQKEGYDLSPKTIFDHEFGHYLQNEIGNRKHKLANLKNKNLLNVYRSLFDQNPSALGAEGIGKGLAEMRSQNYPKLYRNKKTFYDDIAETITPKKNIIGDQLSSYLYFTRDVEPMAHIREMRSNMIKKGFIKDHLSNIDENTIRKFIKKNPKDRVSSFIDDNSSNITDLKYLLNNIPAVAGVVAGTAVLGNKKQGGEINWLNKYK